MAVFQNIFSTSAKSVRRSVNASVLVLSSVVCFEANALSSFIQSELAQNSFTQQRTDHPLAQQASAPEPFVYQRNSKRPHTLFIAQRDQSSARMISMNEAISIAKRRHNAEVLSARRSVNSSGKAVYVIKLLTPGGVVKKVRINAHR